MNASSSFLMPHAMNRYKRVVQRYEDGGTLLLALQHMADDQANLETKAAAQSVLLFLLFFYFSSFLGIFSEEY